MPENLPDVLDGLERLDGPWSLADAPADATFIDFGALRVGAVEGLRFRPEYDQATRTCGAVSIRSGLVQVQLQVVAAPRGEDRWTALRPQMAERLRAEGAHVSVVEGDLGPELAVLRPHQRPDGTTAAIPMRVQGIGGDRWMLKVTSIGPTVHDAATRAKVDALVSRCAVERGSGPAVAGSVLELTPPPGAPRPGAEGGRA
ncbi:DUF3710 domain-containing protein [Demequina sp. NBRC 110057]|uniref:DUF3710 domain-containing protein n=1 Tax=Demequina sp. NBRC 110057 TaxID=1570346 RepID=UPI0009FEC3EE|nr:DUF3710 domain-containing protein [Demequina sp. NBRC 110057]